MMNDKEEEREKENIKRHTLSMLVAIGMATPIRGFRQALMIPIVHTILSLYWSAYLFFNQIHLCIKREHEGERR